MDPPRHVLSIPVYGPGLIEAVESNDLPTSARTSIPVYGPGLIEAPGSARRCRSATSDLSRSTDRASLKPGKFRGQSLRQGQIYPGLRTGPH